MKSTDCKTNKHKKFGCNQSERGVLRMKITAITVYDYQGFITVKVDTDEGISGFGESGLGYGRCREAAFSQCVDLARVTLGKDPFDTEKIWDFFHHTTFWGLGGGVVITAAMAAIDIACWDIKGKALNLPVYKLLGGRTNQKLRTYASQLQLGWRSAIEKGDSLKMMVTAQEYYDATKDAIADGYDAVKVDPIQIPGTLRNFAEVFSTGGTHIRGSIRNHQIATAVERIAAMREAGGPDLDIIVELHSLTDTNTATILGRALEPYNIFYYEEPTSPENPSNFRYIRDHCNLPLATGERSYTRWGFRQFFEDRTLDIVQPDLANTGGITETKKICDMAEVYDIGVQVHIFGGPIATAAALQLEATIPNFVIHEEHGGNLRSSFKRAGKYYYAPEQGYYDVPELPGIGQEMSEEAMATEKQFTVR